MDYNLSIYERVTKQLHYYHKIEGVSDRHIIQLTIDDFNEEVYMDYDKTKEALQAIKDYSTENSIPIMLNLSNQMNQYGVVYMKEFNE